MKVNFNKENTVKILESYYKEVEGSDAKQILLQVQDVKDFMRQNVLMFILI